MQRQHHYSNGSHLHFITASDYRRPRLLTHHDSERAETLDQLTTGFDFQLVGYVLMPEHFHLLTSPSKAIALLASSVVSNNERLGTLLKI